MTSQLIIGNGTGVALASSIDVMTTTSTTNRYHGPTFRSDGSAISYVDDGSRTYESDETIYELPDPHRLAVMHCGNGLRDRIPIGVLVKEWIRCLPAEPKESVDDYRDGFVSWFGNTADKWQSAYERNVAAWISLLGQVVELADLVKQDLGRAEEGEPPTDVVLGTLRYRNEALAHLEQIVSSATAESIIDSWRAAAEAAGSSIDESVRRILDGIPRSETIDEEIRTFLRLVVEKGVEFPDGSWSNLVFVGYGANDLLPTKCEVELGGSLEKTVWHTSDELYPPNQWGGSYTIISSLEEDDMISLFLKGYDEEMNRAATDMALDSLYASGKLDPPDQVPEGQVAPREGGLGSATAEMIEAVKKASFDLSFKRRLDPTFKTVAVMPLLDLAAAADALVAMQALTLKIRGQLPSVGGHIDVATITVNEGFRWISHG